MTTDAPLILTLRLDDLSQRFFDDHRRTHFPPECNFLNAHLTLFHHLPGNEPRIKEDLQSMVQQQPPLNLAVDAVVSIGKGVAFRMHCPALVALHRTLQQQWQHWLTPQDKQGLWPHVTVQNKVTPQTAKDTLHLLQVSFQPFSATGTGFALWRYEGGPWTALTTFPFAGVVREEEKE